MLVGCPGPIPGLPTRVSPNGQATEVGCHRPSPAKGQGTAGAVAASADHRLREANGRIGSTHVGDRFHSSCPRCRRSSRSPTGRGRNCEDCPSPWMRQADVGTSREAMAWRECCRAHRDLGLRRPLGCIELAQRGCSAAHGASTDYGAPVTDPLSGTSLELFGQSTPVLVVKAWNHLASPVPHIASPNTSPDRPR